MPNAEASSPRLSARPELFSRVRASTPQTRAGNNRPKPHAGNNRPNRTHAGNNRPNRTHAGNNRPNRTHAGNNRPNRTDRRLNTQQVPSAASWHAIRWRPCIASPVHPIFDISWNSPVRHGTVSRIPSTTQELHLYASAFIPAGTSPGEDLFR